MKYAMVILFLIGWVFQLEAKQWGNSYFVMELPKGWETPETGLESSPLRTGDTLDHFRTVCYVPGRNSMAFEAAIFEHKDGREIHYLDFVRDVHVVVSKRNLVINGYPVFEKEGRVKVRNKDVILDRHETYWYIQGKKCVYCLCFGSYEKDEYDRYLKEAVSIVSSFREAK